MAARLNPKNDARTRDTIRTTQLVKRLQAFALSEDDPQTKRPVEMSKEQVRAATALLAKTLPDLRATEHSAGDGFTGGFVLMGQPEAKDAQEWATQHSPIGK